MRCQQQQLIQQSIFLFPEFFRQKDQSNNTVKDALPIMATAATGGSLWWRGTKIVCIGRNYLAHVHELHNKVPSEPFWFLKPPSSLIPTGTPHECPPGRGETHHELELGVIIGKRCPRIEPSVAMEHVAGYCLALDMTDREGQTEAKAAGKPWTACKGWDTSCPVSAFVPIEAVPDYKKLNLWLKVNDEAEPRQYGCTSQMIFDVETCIAAISAVHTLEPGDLVLTGTPEGVGPVRPGDIIKAGIAELDLQLEVPIVAAAADDQ